MSNNKSTPAAAKIEDIIYDLFQNEVVKNQDGSRLYLTISRVKLSAKQRGTLAYPSGTVPQGLYVVLQYSRYNAERELVSTSIDLVSFTKRADGYIYGYYFKVEDQGVLNINELVESCKPIKLSNEAKIVNDNYVEVYNNVLGTTVILGLSTGEKISASLQYSKKSNYYYEVLEETGIKEPNYPQTALIGLSKNLSIHG
jgi:hypothetical protein